MKLAKIGIIILLATATAGIAITQAQSSPTQQGVPSIPSLLNQGGKIVGVSTIATNGTPVVYIQIKKEVWFCHASRWDGSEEHNCRILKPGPY